jgi:hypothetical protein
MLATTIHKSNTTPHHQSEATTPHPTRKQGRPHRATGVLSQSPIVCLAVLAGSITRNPYRLNVVVHPAGRHYSG